MTEIETNSAGPLVSVVILYYKRRDTIEESLDSVLRQDYPNREIILVDNHSEDDVAAVAAARGSAVHLIQLPENRGACGGRNVGICAARGEIIVVLEDDVSFLSPFEMARLVKAFAQRPDYHVLALQICDPDTGKLRLREWCHPRYWKDASEEEFETLWFGEGASAFRREVFEKAGMYYEPFFYGAEGDDLVLRLLDHGFRILHVPQVRVGHRASEKGRSSHRQYYYFTRNYIWTAYKDYHFVEGVKYLVPKLCMMLYFGIRASSLGSFMRGLWDGVLGLGKVKVDRTPTSKQALRRLAQLEKSRPKLWIRLARHKEAPQI
jgi:GT2 family glycosyltransferase